MAYSDIKGLRYTESKRAQGVRDSRVQKPEDRLPPVRIGSNSTKESFNIEFSCHTIVGKG